MVSRWTFGEQSELAPDRGGNLKSAGGRGGTKLCFATGGGSCYATDNQLHPGTLCYPGFYRFILKGQP